MLLNFAGLDITKINNGIWYQQTMWQKYMFGNAVLEKFKISEDRYNSID